MVLFIDRYLYESEFDKFYEIFYFLFFLANSLTHLQNPTEFWGQNNEHDKQ